MKIYHDYSAIMYLERYEKGIIEPDVGGISSDVSFYVDKEGVIEFFNDNSAEIVFSKIKQRRNGTIVN